MAYELGETPRYQLHPHKRILLTLTELLVAQRLRTRRLPSSSHDYMTMATLSQADIDVILDALCVGILKRLNDCHHAEDVVENSHEIDGILKRFTSVDALVDTLR